MSIFAKDQNLRWRRYTRQQAGQLPSFNNEQPWRDYDVQRRANSVGSTRYAALLSVDRQVADDLLRAGGHPAIARAVGERVLVCDALFQNHPTDRSRYLGALLVTPGMHRLTMGIDDADGGFVSLTDARSKSLYCVAYHSPVLVLNPEPV